jgi:hypothetical protein
MRFGLNLGVLNAHENIISTIIMCTLIRDVTLSLSVKTTDDRLCCMRWLPSTVSEINTDTYLQHSADGQLYYLMYLLNYVS